MREKLEWWEVHLSQWNGGTLVLEKPAVIIEQMHQSWAEEQHPKESTQGTLVKARAQDEYYLTA